MKGNIKMNLKPKKHSAFVASACGDSVVSLTPGVHLTEPRMQATR